MKTVKSKDTATALVGFREAYQTTVQFLREVPAATMLFILIAVVDYVLLTALFLSHSAPFSAVLAPIIRTFYHDRYLHYPENFILLPKIFKHAHFVLTCTMGILVSGMVVLMAEGFVKGKRVLTLNALLGVFKRYVPLLGAWLASYFAVFYVLQFLQGILPPLPLLHISLSFLFALLLQALLIYLIPAVLLGSAGLLKNIAGGFSFGIKYWVLTSCVIAPPLAFALVLSIIKSISPVFVRDFPEAVLIILAAGVVVTNIVDLLVTSSTALIYLKERAQS